MVLLRIQAKLNTRNDEGSIVKKTKNTCNAQNRKSTLAYLDFKGKSSTTTLDYI